jgi:hypothetical protein
LRSKSRSNSQRCVPGCPYRKSSLASQCRHRLRRKLFDSLIGAFLRQF